MNEIKVLDHGFVKLLDHMGDDATICKRARLSNDLDAEIKPVEDDKKLIDYLWRNAHCYHPSMQVLTLGGWKKWDECGEYETYLVPDPHTRSLKKETLKLEVFDVEDEKMFTFSNNRMSYSVSNNHRMWFKGKYQSSFSIERVQNMLKWGHFDPITGYSFFSNSEENELDPLSQLIGFYLGDGSHASLNIITFHLKKERKIQYLESVLNKLGWSFSKIPSATHTMLGSLGWVFRVDIPTESNFFSIVSPKRGYIEKKLLVSVETLSIAHMRGILDGLTNSDGSVKKDRDQIQFSSKSPDLLHLYETLSTMTGVDTHYTSPNSIIRGVTAFCGSRTSLEARAQYFGETRHTGNIYCTTTSTGLLMVRGGPDKFAFVCGNTSPFEMVEFTFEMKLPIFVARQMIRHRTANVNEVSARYTELPEEYYIPEDFHNASASVKQGRSDNISPLSQKLKVRYEDEMGSAFDAYRWAISQGVSKEEARIILPVATYTRWAWKMDLNNLLKTLSLRCDSHAQYEIRVYAEAMLELIRPIVPQAIEAWERHTRYGLKIDSLEADFFRELLKMADEQSIQVGGDRANRILREKLGLPARIIDPAVLALKEAQALAHGMIRD